MARLPDGSAFGALPSALSGRPIATYDVSGYARGAAAMADGVSDLGKGIPRVAGGFDDMYIRAARANLDQAKANASYVLKTNELRASLAQESDPDAVATAYPEQFRRAFNEANSLIGDPQTREVWGLARGADRDGQIAASLDQAAALRRRQEVQSVTAQLDTLRTLALDNDDEATRDSLIGAGQKLIAGLEDTRLLDEAGGRAMRESWTRAYATESLGRLPPDERIKLLREGQGTVAEFIPEDERQDLARLAQADTADAQRKAQSDAALAQYTTRQAIDDDLKQVQATGRGRDDLTPQRIDDALGPEARRAWLAQRDDARTIWALTHDLSTLTDEEIDKRVASVTPKGGEAADSADTPAVSARQQAVYDQVRERAAKLRELRRADPAGSVADDPNVRAAQEAYDPQKPESAKALIDARLAAQERAGIAKPSVLTSNEERDLLRPLAQAARDAAGKTNAPGITEQAQERFRQRIEETYGAHAETVMRGVAERLTATIAEAAGADGSPAAEQDDGLDRSLISPVQFRPGVGLGTRTAANAKAAQALTSAIKDIPDAPRRTAAYAAATFQILNWYLRRQVLNQQADDPDKPSEPIKPLDAGRAVEREAVKSNSDSSHHDPEEPEEKPLIEKALTAAKIAEAAKSIGKDLPALPEGARFSGESDHGPIVEGLEGKWDEAVDWLQKAQRGEIKGVLRHPLIDDAIDIVWGQPRLEKNGIVEVEGYGLAKILQLHPEIVRDFPARFAKMKIVQVGANRIRFLSEESGAVVSLNYLGKEKKWLLTAYELSR